MKRKTSQLNAIWYTYRSQRINRMKQAGVYEDFLKSRYTSPAWYLKSINRYFDLY